ncbi:SAM-dependent methyltransferase, partial [Salmonella enterica subsp. enterica serovar Istanbul]|nr:SAM-dependent methyltransferase [Salmonella enterica subsp. enterica serovar Istanbul]
AKENGRGLRGLDARTGASNFDVSEWMVVRLLESLAGHDATLAMLCKAAVARRVVETVAARELDVRPVG